MSEKETFMCMLNKAEAKMTEVEKANNFMDNITKAGAIVNKKGTVTATYTEGEQIYFICSIDCKVVDTLYLTKESTTADYIMATFREWAKHPVFVTPNLKSFETYTEC